MGQFASDKVYDDAADGQAIDALHAHNPQRDIADAIVNAHKEGKQYLHHVDRTNLILSIPGYVKAYIPSPPLVYGLAAGILVDAGVQNPVASGMLILSRIAKSRGSVGYVGPQVNIWSTVHVQDRESFNESHLSDILNS